MGCGYAVYCGSGWGPEVVALCSELELGAHVAGAVTDGPRRVVLRELDVVYRGDDLDFTPRA